MIFIILSFNNKLNHHLDCLLMFYCLTNLDLTDCFLVSVVSKVLHSPTPGIVLINFLKINDKILQNIFNAY